MVDRRKECCALVGIQYFFCVVRRSIIHDDEFALLLPAKIQEGRQNDYQVGRFIISRDDNGQSWFFIHASANIKLPAPLGEDFCGWFETKVHGLLQIHTTQLLISL